MSQFQQNQSAIQESLEQNAFVAVFQVKTHNGKMTILEDAFNKVKAMYDGGVRKFEFLLRGDETIPLDTSSPLGRTSPGLQVRETYVGQVLNAVDFLAPKFPDAIFGAGTISSPQIMKQVVANKNIKFVMTAHWPDEEIVQQAVNAGVPILATSSHGETVIIKPSGKGELVEPEPVTPGINGNDKLNPDRLSILRGMGVSIFKASDFTKIAMRRAQEAPHEPSGESWANVAKINPLARVSFGLIAIAEAIRESYHLDSQPIPKDQTFYAATTGGVDMSTLPHIARGIKGPLREQIEAILGKEAAAPICSILDRTTVGAGGTFLTKDYDNAIKSGQSIEIAKAQLAELSKQAMGLTKTNFSIKPRNVEADGEAPAPEGRPTKPALLSFLL